MSKEHVAKCVRDINQMYPLVTRYVSLDEMDSHMYVIMFLSLGKRCALLKLYPSLYAAYRKVRRYMTLSAAKVISDVCIYSKAKREFTAKERRLVFVKAMKRLIETKTYTIHHLTYSMHPSFEVSMEAIIHKFDSKLAKEIYELEGEP